MCPIKGDTIINIKPLINSFTERIVARSDEGMRLLIQSSSRGDWLCSCPLIAELTIA